MIRVHHLIKGLGRGGAERLLVEMLAVSSPEYRHSFTYFLPWKDAFANDLRAQGVNVTCLGARSTAECLIRTPQVARALRRDRIDLLHCHMPIASVVGRLAGRLAGVPVVSTEHNMLERYHPATRALSLRTWQLQRQVIAVSAEVQQSIARHAGSVVPVEVVRNGVATDRFRATPEDRHAIRRRHGIADDAVVVGTVAVFRTQKRLDLWLEAARRVEAAHPGTRFLLVGDGPLKADVEAAARGTRGAVLAGLQEDVPAYLSAMDVFFMSSDFEGLPVALLEAMAAGLPSVLTRVGGIAEVVRDDVEGFLHASGDVGGLAHSLERLTGDPALRRRLGSAAHDRVESSFGVATMMRNIEAVYRSTLCP